MPAGQFRGCPDRQLPVISVTVEALQDRLHCANSRGNRPTFRARASMDRLVPHALAFLDRSSCSALAIIWPDKRSSSDSGQRFVMLA